MNAADERLAEWIRVMPKAELHLHLDGSLRPATALELARDRDVGLDTASMDVAAMRDRLVAPPRCRDQAELLRAFDLPIALLQDREALERCTSDLVEDVAGDGTHYAEIRWAPSLHTEGGLSLRDGISAVAHSARSAAVRMGIEIRLIAVALRTHDPETASTVAMVATEFMAEGLTGFDLAGAEEEEPDPRQFAAAFDIARAAGLGISCHAGEWGGPSQVRDALALDPWRIAHGAPAADDPQLTAELRDRGVTLDICPTSNLQAGIGSDDANAPLPRLIEAGVPVTINTDDRTVSDLTLVREMGRAVTDLGVTPAQLVELTRHAHAVAFLHHDEPVRTRLIGEFEAWRASDMSRLPEPT
jgi:adenosine deaminase